MNKLFVLILLAVLAMPTASALQNTTLYFVPQDGSASSCGDTIVQVRVNAPYGINGVYFGINYSASCIDITNVAFNPDWPGFGPLWNNTYQPDCWGPGNEWLKFGGITDWAAGDYWLCNLTIDCIDPTCTYCQSHLNFACGNLDCSSCLITACNTTGGTLQLNTTNGTFTCGTPSAETFSKPLYTGWNLISLPLVPDDSSVSAVLSTVSYDAVYRYNATSKKFESADVMDSGTGYFVHAAADCTWVYSGTAYTSANVPMEHGLNMVGWLNCSKNVDALSSISGDYYYVARWNTTAEKFEVYNPAAPSAFNDFATMDRGTGYFISTKQDCTGCALSENC